jgi:hypothetical protein
MDLDPKVYLGSCVQLYLLAETPRLPPPAFGFIYGSAKILEDRHLFVTPCLVSRCNYLIMVVGSLEYSFVFYFQIL